MKSSGKLSLQIEYSIWRAIKRDPSPDEIFTIMLRVKNLALFKENYAECVIDTEIKNNDTWIVTTRAPYKLIETLSRTEDDNIIALELSKAFRL